MKRFILLMIPILIVTMIIAGCGDMTTPAQEESSVTVETTTISESISEIESTTEKATLKVEITETPKATEKPTEKKEEKTAAPEVEESVLTQAPAEVTEEEAPVYEEPVVEEIVEEVVEESAASGWDGPVLTASKGVNYGPTGKETYYNMDMSGIVRAVQRGGWLYNDCINKNIIDNILDSSGYWVREDGCKMFGPYIIVAANLDHFHRGSIVECSLGTAIVLDTGSFASWDEGWSWLDIATTW